MRVQVEVKSNKLKEVRGQLSAVTKAVDKAAFDIAAHAKTLAPVDTGALVNSIWAATAQGSDWPQAIQAALARNPKAQALPIPAQPQPGEAYVGVGVHYGIYVEYGTRRMAARPYLRPAADAVRPAFEAAVKAILRRLGR